MSEYSLEFIGRMVLEMRAEMRDRFGSVNRRLDALERTLDQLKDEQLVNTAWFMRDRAEPIAAAALQNQIQRMNVRLEGMERRVGLVEARLPVAE